MVKFSWPYFFSVIFKQDFWEFIITLWCLKLISSNTFHDYPSKTKIPKFPNSSNQIKPVCSISFTSWVAFRLSTPMMVMIWLFTIWRDDCSSFCIITSETQKKGRQSSVYPRKFIKTKKLPKNFWQDFWQETKSIYQFLSIAYRNKKPELMPWFSFLSDLSRYLII